MPGLLAKVGHFVTGSGSVGAQPSIYHMRQGNLPEFRFEWHRGSKRVYWIDVALGEKTKCPVGNVFAFDIENEGQAVNAVLHWCRGYIVCKSGMTHDDSGKQKLVIMGQE